MNGGEECLLCKVEEVPANWKLVKIQYGGRFLKDSGVV